MTEQNRDTSPVVRARVPRQIGPRGGQIQTPGERALLEVPAGAFGEEMAVTVEDLTPGEPVILDGRWIWPIQHLRLEAHHADGRRHHGTFDRPMRLALRYGHHDLKGTTRPIAIYGRATPADPWQRVPSRHDPRTHTVEADLHHFSEYMGGIDANQAILGAVDSFQTDLWMGAVSLSIPIVVPPGTNGMAPTLSLTYSSGAPQGAIGEARRLYEQLQSSWVGLGWSLDLGYIEPAGDLYVESRATLVLNGRTSELIKTSVTNGDHRHEYRAQDDDGLRIVFYKDTVTVDNVNVNWEYFLVHDRAGTEYRFGYENDSFANPGYYHSSGARQDGHDGDNRRMIRFYLDRVRDVNGNEMNIQYQADRRDGWNSSHYWEEALYLKEISYSVNQAATGSNTDHKRRVVFNLSPQGARTDLPLVPDYSFRRYLDSIVTQTLENGVWTTARTYTFGYGGYEDYTSEPSGRKFLVLRTLTETGGNGEVLPTRTFTYTRRNGWAQPQNGDGRYLPMPLLESVANGYGGKVTYAYQAQAWKYQGGGDNARSQWWTVTSRTVDDGLGRSFVTAYTGLTPRWITKFAPLNTPVDFPLFRGFARVFMTEPGPTGAANGPRQEHRFFQGTRDGTNGATIEWSEMPRPPLVGADPIPNTLNSTMYDAEAFKGRPFEIIHWAPDGMTVLRKELIAYTEAPGGSQNYYASSYNPFQERRDWWVRMVVEAERRVWDGARWNRTLFDYDQSRQGGGQYKNLTDIRQYKDLVDAMWQRQTQRTYRPRVESAVYIIDKVATETVYSGPSAPEWIGGTEYFYDRSASGGDTDPLQMVGSQGRLAGVRRMVRAGATTAYRDARYTYDAWGNLTTRQSWTGLGTPTAWASGGARTETTTYDSLTHTFPATTTNALGQTTARTFDLASGKPTGITDPNGQLTTLAYDRLGRLTSAQGPLVDGARKQMDFTYYAPSAVDPSNSYDSRRTTQVELRRAVLVQGSPSVHTTRSFYDGRGLCVQTYVDWLGGHQAINRRFDGRGLLEAESVPRLVTGTGGFLGDDWLSIDKQEPTRHTYDGLRRPIETIAPGGLVTTQVWDGATRSTIDARRHKKSYATDGLGRLIGVTEWQGNGGQGVDGETSAAWSVYATTSYSYDALDRLIQVVLQDGATTTLSYDELGRKTGQSDPDMGAWSYQYDAVGNLTRQTDARGVQTEMRYDALDRLVAVWFPLVWAEGPIVAGQSRPRIYDLVELRSAVDAALAARGMYGSVGQWQDAPTGSTNETAVAWSTKVRATHMNELRYRIQELWSAAGMGEIENPDGEWNLTPQRLIRARHLNNLRTWLEQYLDHATDYRARVAIGYDSQWWSGGTNLVGRRAWLCDGSGRSSWSYDSYGRATVATRVIDGQPYTTETAYDQLDQVRTLTYPAMAGDAETLTYAYGTDLQLASVSSNLFGTLVDGTSYTWTGQVKTATIHGASGTTVGLNQSYYGVDNIAQGTNPYGALWLQQLGGLVDRRLAYDRVGNVTGLTDVSYGSETLTYTYDHLDRLTDAGNGGSYAESFGYGTTGNLTVKNGQGLGYTDPNHPHAVTGYAGTSYAYDQNGALTQRQSGGVTTTLTYDHAHRVLRVATGAGTICRYAYDGDGNRTKRLDQNGVIHYVGDLYERNLGYGGNQQNRETRYYYAQLGSEHRLLGFRTRSSGTDAPLTIVGTDHLGGTIATASGTTGTPITGRLRYTPFGEARDASGDFGTDRGFTGQTRDAVSGMYWYKSRFYDPVVGRFCQPDTVVPGAGNPQAWNRYAYAMNSPIRLIDPTGHAPKGMDPSWERDFESAHGRAPNAQDRVDRDVSLAHPGTGPNGTWTEDNWKAYGAVQAILGDLLAHVGTQQFFVNESAGMASYSLSGVNLAGGLKEALFFGRPGPDGTFVITHPFGRGIPPPADLPAVTYGNVIIMRSGAQGKGSLLIHEYVHVLQYRALGAAFLDRYGAQGFAAWKTNSFEQQAMDVQDVYEANSWLPKPWQFPWAGGGSVWSK